MVIASSGRARRSWLAAGAARGAAADDQDPVLGHGARARRGRGSLSCLGTTGRAVSLPQRAG